MRNEYTDYIAHGHKYFAVVDLGKKNSNGTKLRRYFYSANEYKAYLQGKKTTDDKLLGAASKVANKLSGVKAIGKGLASTAKAIRNTNKEVKALKKQGYSEEAARDEIKAKSTTQAMKRAGLSSIGPVGYTSMGSEDSKGNYSFKKKAVIEGTDSRGKKYYAVEGSRQIAQAKDNNPVSQKRAELEAEKLAKTKPGRSDNMKTMISEQRGDINKERHEKNKANLKAHPEKSILNNPIREKFVERLVEKGMTKAKAEKLRDTIKNTVGNATAIANVADKINNKLGGIQDALLSGDSEKLYNEMNDLMENAEENQKEMEQIYKSIPIFGTFLDAAEKQNEKFDNDTKSMLDTASKAWDNVNSSTNDVSVLADSAKKTIDAALAGPKTVSEEAKSIIEESEEINKRYEELKKKMNRK